MPKTAAPAFPEEGSHLQRYSQRLNAVEINSSFYRDHQAKTYRRWAAETPDDFRFAVKLSRVFTHDRRLEPEPGLLQKTLDDIAELGKKWEVLLVQLPPSLDFQEKTATEFLTDLRRLYRGAIVIEPRHITWTWAAAQGLLADLQIDKVIADPEPCPSPLPPEGTRYFRLHGAPLIYKSRYEGERLEKWRNQIHQSVLTDHLTWCVFDNTTFGEATVNALELTERRSPPRDQSVSSITQ